MLILFHCNISYASQIVRLFFAAKDIVWQEKIIDLRKYEQITGDYRKISPQGTVPALQDLSNNKIIANSTQIMAYVEKNYVSFDQKTDPALLPAIIDFCKHQESFHDPFLRTLSYHDLFKKAAISDPEKITRIVKQSEDHPNKERGRFLIRAAKGEFSETELAACRKEVEHYLDRLEMLLSKNKENFYLFDSRCYTMADAAATAALYRLYKIDLGNAVEKLSAVVGYYQRMQSEPCFEKANLC
ncbi:MAG: uncharacterized protein K0R12_1107 [Gammaproteobacteria bacterium]|nr:uncharacterized protein [Gammaproteobacteria bacterium]